jgi:hypothetical protein
LKASRCALLLAGLAVVAAAASPARAVTFTVTTAAASGAGSLAEAVGLANAASGPDEIHFAIPGTGVKTIPLDSILFVSEAVVIDGYTQSGASPNTLAAGTNAALLIELDCTATPQVVGGVFNLSAPNITIRGLVMNRAPAFNSAIRLAPGSSNNVIIGNFIGTDPTGLLGGNNGGHGVLIAGGSGHRIGGPAPADRNVISGHGGGGVVMSSVNANTVQGNYIGVNAAGTAALGNGLNGISISVSAGNTVGGTSVGAGNVISANGQRGVRISDSGGSGNVVQGNFIGTDVTGTLDLGNLGDGVGIVNNAPGNLVGGTTASARNVISGNGGDGIEIHGFGAGAANANTVQGNFIGVDAGGVSDLGNDGFGIALVTFVTNSTIGGTAPGARNVIEFNGLGGINASGASSTGNAIRGNSIFSNPGLGIDLGTAGVTPNDALDADAGPNNLQNFPVLVTASSGGGSTNVQGTLHGTPSMTFDIDIFSSPVCDDGGNGEGAVYLGSTTVSTDGSGNGSFNATFPVSVAPQHRITATATDPASNTSEFSACLSLAARFHTVTPCRVADTRDPDGPYGGPALAANTNRDFVIIGRCGVPATAQAVSFNFVVVSPTALGDMRVFPAGGPFALVSTLNFRPAQIRANNAIVPLGPAGGITVRCVQASGTAHFIIDVNGYFE